MLRNVHKIYLYCIKWLICTNYPSINVNAQQLTGVALTGTARGIIIFGPPGNTKSPLELASPLTERHSLKKIIITELVYWCFENFYLLVVGKKLL